MWWGAPDEEAKHMAREPKYMAAWPARQSRGASKPSQPDLEMNLGRVSAGASGCRQAITNLLTPSEWLAGQPIMYFGSPDICLVLHLGVPPCNHIVSASRSPPGLGSDTASRSPPGRGHRFAQSAASWKHVVLDSLCATLLHFCVNS